MTINFNTKPYEKLNPVEIQQDLKELLLHFSNGLNDAVNFGSQILGWEIEKSKGGVENVPVWMLFRHILELVDSIAILVGKSSIDPCKPLLRAALEATLHLEYMLDDDYENRSKAFIVCNYYEKLNGLQKLKQNTPEYKQFISTLSKDKINPLLYRSLDLTGVEVEIDIVNSVLNHCEYSSIKDEYNKLKAKKRKTPKWHQLFSGPYNIEQLANLLNRNAMYEVFYRYWSGSTHGTDILNHLDFNEENNIEILQLRMPKDVQEVVLHASTLLIITFEVIQRTRATIHKSEFERWFYNFQPFFHQLIGPPLIKQTS